MSFSGTSECASLSGAATTACCRLRRRTRQMARTTHKMITMRPAHAAMIGIKRSGESSVLISPSPSPMASRPLVPSPTTPAELLLRAGIARLELDAPSAAVARVCDVNAAVVLPCPGRDSGSGVGDGVGCGVGDAVGQAAPSVVTVIGNASAQLPPTSMHMPASKSFGVEHHVQSVFDCGGPAAALHNSQLPNELQTAPGGGVGNGV